MLLQSFSIFDEIITGTGTTWYTPSDLNAVLGQPDALAIQVATTLVSGTSPTLRMAVEHSGDGRAFLPRVATPEINNTSITNDKSVSVTAGEQFGYTPGTSLLAYVRLAISLGGTNPRCRLRILVTGRNS